MTARIKPREWIASLALLAYLAVLVGLSFGNGEPASTRDVTVWDLQSSRRFLSWVAELAWRGLLDGIRFVPVGFLTVLAVVRLPRWSRRYLASVLLAGALTIAVTVMVRGFEIGRPWQTPGSFDLLLPLVGCLLGGWIGGAWLRGRRALLWLVPKFVLLILLSVVALGTFLVLATERRPAEFEGARVSSAEKRRLVRLLRQKNSLNLQPGEIRSLNLTEHDVDVLLAWGLSIGSDQRKAKVSLQNDAFTLDVSMAVPSLGEGASFLNMRLGARLGVRDGHLNLRLTRLRLGHVDIPRWTLAVLSPILTTAIRHDRRVRPFLKSIEELRLQPEAVEMTYGRLELPKGFFSELVVAPGIAEEVIAATRAQIDHLRARARNLPRGDARFGACLETAFALARSRSIAGDPVLENQAAIFALGIVLGHPRLARLIGPVAEGEVIWQTQRALGRVTMRGRPDWTRHFLVSAALALLSADIVSDAAGLLKEELDAGSGGSGFSFADLLADRAGTTFAVAATRDQAAARAMQDRLARGFEMDAFFPPAADLPEGLSDAELQRRYGGVGGERYQRMVAEIERRIARCAAYR